MVFKTNYLLECLWRLQSVMHNCSKKLFCQNKIGRWYCIKCSTLQLTATQYFWQIIAILYSMQNARISEFTVTVSQWHSRFSTKDIRYPTISYCPSHALLVSNQIAFYTTQHPINLNETTKVRALHKISSGVWIIYLRRRRS